MSLCLAHGHVEAWYYPLGMLDDESSLIVERENGRIVTEAQTLQLGMAGILSPKAVKAFTERVKKLNVQVKPVDGLFDG